MRIFAAKIWLRTTAVEPMAAIFVTWFRDNVSDCDIATLSVDHLNLCL